MADTDPSSGQASCQLRVPGSSALSFITHFLSPASAFPNLQLKNSRRKMAGSVLVTINPQRDGRAGQNRDASLQCWEDSCTDHRALVKGAKVSTLKPQSCFRTFLPTADSEPSRTLRGSGQGGEGSQLSQRLLPERWGDGHHSRCISSTKGHSRACRALRCRRWEHYLGRAKSQAVSWAHFHMACMRRVKPMSLGFSRPLISRCFMMETNSLLLSSPLPGG